MDTDRIKIVAISVIFCGFCGAIVLANLHEHHPHVEANPYSMPPTASMNLMTATSSGSITVASMPSATRLLSY